MNLDKIDNSLDDSDEISLKEIIVKTNEWLKYLVQKWLVISIFGLLGGIAGFAYAYFKKPVYTATTTFVLEDEKAAGGIGNLAGLASMVGVEIGGSSGGLFQGDNILGLYKSRSVIERTLLTQVQDEKGRKQLLVDRYIDFNKLKKKWVDKPELVDIKFQGDSLADGLPLLKPNRLRDSVLGVIVADISKNYLSVTKPDKKLSTIQVDVKTRDEFFAKLFNDELVKNVNEFYVKTKIKKTFQNVKILQHKTDSVRSVMNGAIYTAVAVNDATPNLNPTRQIQRAAPAQRAQFSAETNKSILAEMVKNLEITKMSLLKETPLIQVVDQPIYPLPVEKMSKAKAVLFGGFSGVVLTCLLLVIRKLLKMTLA